MKQRLPQKVWKSNSPQNRAWEAPDCYDNLTFVGAAEEAPQTFDFGVIAAIATAVSAAGYALSKRR